MCGLEVAATFLAAAALVPAQLMWWLWVMGRTAAADLSGRPHPASKVEAIVRIRH